MKVTYTQEEFDSRWPNLRDENIKDTIDKALDIYNIIFNKINTRERDDSLLDFIKDKFNRYIDKKHENDNRIIDELRESKTLTEHRFDTLTERISNKFMKNDDLLRSMTTSMGLSNTKGVIGESMVYNWICESFTNWTVGVVRTLSHSCDIHITDPVDVLIETKYYKRTVPSTQIQNFERNIALNTSKYNMFVCIGSKIAKKKKFELNMIGEKYILYIPNASKDSVILGLLLIKSLNQYLMSYIENEPTLRLNKIVRSIRCFVERSENDIESLRKIIVGFEKNVDNLNKCRMNIYNNIDTQIKSLLSGEE